jgi:hypothetical protein
MTLLLLLQEGTWKKDIASSISLHAPRRRRMKRRAKARGVHGSDQLTLT